MTTSLCGRRCRPKGSSPPAADTRPDDYYLEVVAVMRVGDAVRCGTVDVRSGSTQFRSFLLLEFEPEQE